MRRREVLAALGPALAGCASSPPPRRATTAPGTPLPGPITDCRTPPEPPDDPTREAALEFVRAHEEALVYNWLVAQNGGPDECRPAGPGVSASSAGTGAAARVTVEPARAAVTAESRAGVYVVSSCSGEARYRCPDEGRLCGGAGRNAGFVTHFVGDGRHARVPDNWTTCDVRAEPYRSSDPAENIDVPEGEPGLTFRVYELSGGGRPDGSAEGEGTTVSVVLIHADSGDRVLGETYELHPGVGPLVFTNVAVRSGTYRLVAVAGEGRASHRFTLEGPEDPSLDRICVYPGPGDDLEVVEVETTGDLGPPEPVCFDRYRPTEANAGGGA